jgi:hypothetical protein
VINTAWVDVDTAANLIVTAQQAMIRPSGQEASA